ncbi:MAG: nitroreductase family protein [Candidatus Thorarchaeota archaeon]
MSILNVIKSRRSIRKFKTKQVNLDDVYQIIEAGIWAPSSGNTMPFKFLVMTNKEQKNKFFTLVLNTVVNWKKEAAEEKGITISELKHNYKQYLDGIQKAPVMIFLFFDLEIGAKEFTNQNIDEFIKNEYLYNSLRDSLYLCVENMLLEASAIGLSSLYFELPRAAKTPVNHLFNIDEKYEFFICLPIGYPDEDTLGKERNVEDFLIESKIKL